MSLLDDARRLIEPAVEGAYVYCGGRVAEGHHMPCGLAAVPKIVAALEAAERVIERRLPPSRQVISLPDDVRLVSTEAFYALYDALKGEA